MTNEEYKELRAYEDGGKKKEKEKDTFGRIIFKICLAAILIPFVTVVAIVLAGLVGMSVVIPEIMIPILVGLALISLPGIVTGVIISKKY